LQGARFTTPARKPKLLNLASQTSCPALKERLVQWRGGEQLPGFLPPSKNSDFCDLKGK
jgi:hypothetical protein